MKLQLQQEFMNHRPAPQISYKYDVTFGNKSKDKLN